MKIPSALFLFAIAPSLARADCLFVRAKDAQGQPVEGLSLAVSEEAPGPHLGFTSDAPQTGEGGLATLVVPETFFSDLASGDRYWLLADVIGAEDVAFPLSKDLASGSTVDIQIPATWRLEGAVLCSQDDVALNGYAQFEWASEGSQATDWSNPTQMRRRRALVDGVFHSPPIALGARVHVRLILPGRSTESRTPIAGPEASNRVMHAEFEVPGDAALALQVLDEFNQPLQHRSLRASWTYVSRDPSTSHAASAKSERWITEASTDASGNVLLRMHTEFLARSRITHLSLRESRRYGHDADEFFATRGTIEIESPALVPGGVIQLGERAMGPAALLIAGRVLDERGQGVPHAKVSLQKGLPPLPRVWSSVPGVGAQTDATGRFEIRGFFDDLELPSSSSPNGYSLYFESSGSDRLPQRIPWPEDNQELNVTLPPAGQLRIQPAWKDRESAQDVRFKLKSKSTEGWVADPIQVNNAQLLWGPLRTGAYELYAIGTDVPCVLLTLDDLLVVEGELTLDPRTHPVDLSDALRPLHIAVQDETGQPISGATIQSYGNEPDLPLQDLARKDTGEAKDADSNLTHSTRTGSVSVRQGVGRLLAPANQPFDLRVEAKGYRPVLVRDVTESLTVTMHASLRTTFALGPSPDGLELSDARFYITNSAARATGFGASGQAGLLDERASADGRLKAELPGPGPYELLVKYPPAVQLPGLDRDLLISCSFPEPMRSVFVHVSEEDAGRVIQIPLPPRED